MADDINNQIMRDTLAVNLSYLILQSGDSQARVAERTGISPSTLNSYLKGQRYPRPGQLNALAKYFHTTVGRLTDAPTGESQHDQISSEAKQIAYSFDELDAHGKELVRLILNAEMERMHKNSFLYEDEQ